MCGHCCISGIMQDALADELEGRSHITGDRLLSIGTYSRKDNPKHEHSAARILQPILWACGTATLE